MDGDNSSDDGLIWSSPDINHSHAYLGETTMTLGQEEQDAYNHIENRLMLWVKDSMALFDMIDSPRTIGTACIVKVLLRNLCAALASYNASDDDVCDIVREHMALARRNGAKVRARRAKS
jgi:hypothetical protein